MTENVREAPPHDTIGDPRIEGVGEMTLTSSPRAHLRGYSAAELTARVERFRAEAADFASRAHALACAGELTPLTVEQRREQASLMQRARYRLREIRALEQRGIPEVTIAAVGIQAAKLRAYGDAVDGFLGKNAKSKVFTAEERQAMAAQWATSTCAPPPKRSLWSRFTDWLFSP